jgi:negative regulator of sigma E activity
MTENKKETSKNPNLEEAREHFHAARDAMHKSIEALMPEGFRENRRSAQKEILLGMRKMVDAAIVHVEKHSAHD